MRIGTCAISFSLSKTGIEVEIEIEIRRIEWTPSQMSCKEETGDSGPDRNQKLKIRNGERNRQRNNNLNRIFGNILGFDQAPGQGWNDPVGFELMRGNNPNRPGNVMGDPNQGPNLRGFEGILALLQRRNGNNARANGLSRDRIAQIQEIEFQPNPESEQDNTCIICYEDFEAGERIKLLECTHRFHSACIGEWLARKDTCPLCVTRVNI